MTNYLRNISDVVAKFKNVSLNNILRMATKTHQIIGVFSTRLFTVNDYRTLSNPFGDEPDVTLDTLRKYGLIDVADVHVKNLYVKRGRWGDYDIIPMTDAQYEMLPDYFKQDVDIQTRKTYYYRINIDNISQLLNFADMINPTE